MDFTQIKGGYNMKRRDQDQTQDIKKQLEVRKVEILEQLEKGEDIQISYQKSKNKLHVKKIKVERL